MIKLQSFTLKGLLILLNFSALALLIGVRMCTLFNPVPFDEPSFLLVKNTAKSERSNFSSVQHEELLSL